VIARALLALAALASASCKCYCNCLPVQAVVAAQPPAERPALDGTARRLGWNEIWAGIDEEEAVEDETARLVVSPSMCKVDGHRVCVRGVLAPSKSGYLLLIPTPNLGGSKGDIVHRMNGTVQTDWILLLPAPETAIPPVEARDRPVDVCGVLRIERVRGKSGLFVGSVSLLDASIHPPMVLPEDR
jgi:hypothetical protein